MRAACGSACNGLLFFSTPKCLFPDRALGLSCFRPQQVFFSTSIFFFNPATRSRKRLRSFFRPPLWDLSRLFLSPSRKRLFGVWKKTSRPATQTTLKKSECESNHLDPVCQDVDSFRLLKAVHKVRLLLLASFQPATASLQPRKLRKFRACRPSRKTERI